MGIKVIGFLLKYLKISTKKKISHRDQYLSLKDIVVNKNIIHVTNIITNNRGTKINNISTIARPKKNTRKLIQELQFRGYCKGKLC